MPVGRSILTAGSDAKGHRTRARRPRLAQVAAARRATAYRAAPSRSAPVTGRLARPRYGHASVACRRPPCLELGNFRGTRDAFFLVIPRQTRESSLRGRGRAR